MRALPGLIVVIGVDRSARDRCRLDRHLLQDIDGDGTVGFGDLLILLGAWGSNPGHPADFDDSGTVDFSDLLALLGAWGQCS